MMRLVTVTAGLLAQRPNVPHGMYCGGNQLVFEGNLKGTTVAGVVRDQNCATIRGARVQVQIEGRDEILKDFSTDDRGGFQLRALRSGEYWLGISSADFNIHYWHLTIMRSGGVAKVRVALSLGT